ncbi:putative adhesin [uncultured Desulfosarcina sp.]|uniref:putative adhesin n=1 Tax=uncultured Desulfosarcina sp. TaxID=218289 RepID=UPI0029C74988|nr:hypothetical protein [uncultured Desulfosarcina sp.]
MGKFNCGRFYILSAESNPLNGSAGKDLIISSHGGWEAGDGTFRPTGTRFEIQFYTFEHVSAIGEVIDAINGTVEPIDAGAGSPIKNYGLEYYEHDPSEASILSAIGNKPVHVLTIKPDEQIALADTVRMLHNSQFQYKRVRCLFCRYTGGNKVANARSASEGEKNRLNKLAMTHDIVRELNQRNRFYA